MKKKYCAEYFTKNPPLLSTVGVIEENKPVRLLFYPYEISQEELNIILKALNDAQPKDEIILESAYAKNHKD